MDWQRERDGLVVVGGAVLVLLVIGTGSGDGIVATFLATFLGVLAALRFDDWLDGTDDDATEPTDRPPAAPATPVESESSPD